MLNNHSELFLPSEQYFLGLSVIRYKVFNYLPWRELVKVLVAEMQAGMPAQTWNFEIAKTVSELFTSDEKSLEHIIDLAYTNYGQQAHEQFSRWGDTTSPNTRYCEEIFCLFPKATYFFLIRDGRDVVSSYLQGGESAFNELAILENAVNHWEAANRSYEWLQKRTNVLAIRYEELVTRPQEVLTNICRNLGLAYQADMERIKELPDLGFYQQDYQQNLKKGLFADSIGKWKTTLSADQQRFCQQHMMSGLKAWGYL